MMINKLPQVNPLGRYPADFYENLLSEATKFSQP